MISRFNTSHSSFPRCYFSRFLGSKEHLLRSNETVEIENKVLPYSLILPMARAIAANWTNGNRREAGMFLSHISSSGPTASDIVSTTSRVLKIDSVQLLESQMASLRQSYEKWVDDEPEVDSDRPTEEEMAEFEEAERKHREQFAALEQRASNFSQSLGIFGKLSDNKLGPALNGFIQEGIRFSFSNLDNNGEDTLVLGSRLSFLLLLSKYSNWAKKNKQNKAEIQEYIDGLEVEMRNHEEFVDVHEDDLAALDAFRQNIGLKPLPKSSLMVASQDTPGGDAEDDESMDSVSDLHATPSSAKPRTGRRSSSTMISRASLSRTSDLPPVPEAEEETPPNMRSEDDHDSHQEGESCYEDDSPSASRFSASTKRSRSQASRSQMTYSGHSAFSDDESSGLEPRKKIRSK